MNGVIKWWRQRSRRRFICLDCGGDTLALNEYYMLWPDVWFRVTPGLDGMLCVGCVERRLARRLNCHDFTAAPTNFEGWKSARLRSRLFGSADASETAP